MSFQLSTPRLILASASSARQSLLTRAGIAFEVQVSGVDEAEIKHSVRAEGMSADDTALLLAEMKTRRIARSNPDALIIGCDQMLVCDGRWFDKPVDLAEARSHLLALQGHTHTLVTAVICQIGEQRIWHHIAHPKLTMRRMSDAFLDAYLKAEGMVLTHTVGAYRLEALGAHLFDRIEGEHSAILGLPMLPLLGFLRQHGVLIG